MNQDKKVYYILSFGFLIALLLLCLIPKTFWFSNLIIAAFAVLAAALICYFIKKKKSLAIEYRQVTLLMLTIALFVLALYYLSGLGFGFYKVPIPFTYIWQFIVPYAAAIVASEFIRKTCLAQDNKLLSTVSFASLVLLDALLLWTADGFRTFDIFMSFVGMALIPAITSNLLFHYLSSKYGAFPNICYRMIIGLYTYIIPLRPAMPESMHAFVKLVLPLVIYLFIHALYDKKEESVGRKKQVISVLTTVFMLVFMTAYIMLISCQFHFGLIVIGSESMTGKIDKGDAIIYERYDGRVIAPDEIIIFDMNGVTTVHRVVMVERVNGETRYYTKGDANDAPDQGYITADKIIGVRTMTIKFLGYPSVWMRELFAK